MPFILSQGVEAVLNGIKNDTTATLTAARGQDPALHIPMHRCYRLCKKSCEMHGICAVLVSRSFGVWRCLEVGNTE